VVVLYLFSLGPMEIGAPGFDQNAVSSKINHITEKYSMNDKEEKLLKLLVTTLIEGYELNKDNIKAFSSIPFFLFCLLFVSLIQCILICIFWRTSKKLNNV
jgi:hypothetical protein